MWGNVNFHRVCKGFILIPPKTINLPHTIREDYNFRSYKYMVVNNKGEAQYFTLHPKSKEKKGNILVEGDVQGLLLLRY